MFQLHLQLLSCKVFIHWGVMMIQAQLWCSLLNMKLVCLIFWHLTLSLPSFLQPLQQINQERVLRNSLSSGQVKIQSWLKRDWETSYLRATPRSRLRLILPSSTQKHPTQKRVSNPLFSLTLHVISCTREQRSHSAATTACIAVHAL